MNADLSAAISQELAERARQATAEFVARKAAKLRTRQMFKTRRDAGLEARHAAKIPRQRQASDASTMGSSPMTAASSTDTTATQ
jgi:hypothetical protein